MKFTIFDRCILHLWKASEMYYFDSQTGPSVGLDSHIFWESRVRQAPNCIALGANNLSVEAFTYGVVLSGSLL